MKKTLMVLVAAFALSASARGEELQFGDVIEGDTSERNPAIYTFEADEAGALTVVVRSTDGEDVVLLVTDSDGYPLEDGRIDSDFGGNSGAEQGVVILPNKGEYQVHVRPYGSGSADYELVASWIPWDEVEMPIDEDGRPSGAQPLEPGDWVSGDIGYDEGDREDWYRVEADSDGELIVETRGSEGDVVLEVYAEGEWLESLDRSDQDLDEEYTSEMLSSYVDEGDVYYFKVTSYGSATEYEILATLEGEGGGDDDGGSRPRIEK